jgi:hypothetical protein
MLFHCGFVNGIGTKGFKKVKKEIKANSADRVRIAIIEFMEPLASDCEFFVWNKRTFGNESFHSLCNRYYEKGSVISFPLFLMKRQMAMLDWNEQMRKKALGQEDLEIQEWQEALMNRLRDALAD